MKINHIQEKELFSLGVHSDSVLVTSGCFDPNHADVKSIYLQAKNTFEVLDSVLKEAGLSKEDVISASVWLPVRTKTPCGIPTVKPEDSADFNKAWNEYFKDVKKPARDTVGVGFVVPTFLVEIKFIVAKK